MSNETEDSVRSVSTSACVKSELGWGSAPERTRSAIPERQLTVLTQLGQFLRITLPDFSSVAFSATLCRVASLPASPCGALRGTPDPLERHRGRNQPAGSGRPRALRHSISGSSLRGIARGPSRGTAPEHVTQASRIPCRVFLCSLEELADGGPARLRDHPLCGRPQGPRGCGTRI